MKKGTGFTIIELLVIISILGLISSIALANLDIARDKARTAAASQFAATVNHSLSDTIIGSWNFEDGTAGDTSGNGYDGIIVGSHSIVSPGYDGTGNALYLDGGHVDIEGPGQYTGGITFSGWFNSTTNTNVSTIFSGGDDECSAYSLNLSSGKIAIGSNSTSPSIANNVWNHVIASFDNGGTVEVYINGVPTPPVQNPDSCEPDTGEEPLVPDPENTFSLADLPKWTIGQPVNSPNNLFNGRIDNVFLYGNTITAKEAGEIYAESLRKFKLAGNQ